MTRPTLTRPAMTRTVTQASGTALALLGLVAAGLLALAWARYGHRVDLRLADQTLEQTRSDVPRRAKHRHAKAWSPLFCLCAICMHRRPSSIVLPSTLLVYPSPPPLIGSSTTI